MLADYHGAYPLRRLVTTALMLVVAVAGCGPLSRDYSDLLLTDIRLDPAHQFYRGTVLKNPDGKPGVSAVFTTWDGTTIVDSILVLPDASAASSAMEQAKATPGTMVSRGNPEPAPVGSSGSIVTGRSPDGKAVTVVTFTEGKTFTTLEFKSPTSDPVPTVFIVPVASQQDARIKSEL